MRCKPSLEKTIEKGYAKELDYLALNDLNAAATK